MQGNVIQMPTYSQYTDRATGWNAIAGSDVQRQRKITRYMLCVNHAPNTDAKERAVVLATKNTRTDWQLFAKGKPRDMVVLFESLDSNNELR